MNKSLITAKEVEKVASLARIDLSKRERERFAIEIDSILGFVKDLDKADVQNFQSFNHYASDNNKFRVDEVMDPTESIKEGMRRLFPKRKNDFLEVKTVLKNKSKR